MLLAGNQTAHPLWAERRRSHVTDCPHVPVPHPVRGDRVRGPDHLVGEPAPPRFRPPRGAGPRSRAATGATGAAREQRTSVPGDLGDSRESRADGRPPPPSAGGGSAHNLARFRSSPTDGPTVVEWGRPPDRPPRGWRRHCSAHPLGGAARRAGPADTGCRSGRGSSAGHGRPYRPPLPASACGQAPVVSRARRSSGPTCSICQRRAPYPASALSTPSGVRIRGGSQQSRRTVSGVIRFS